MITPRIALVAYADRSPAFIFVAIPDQRGRYLRTDRSVALVACPHCQAIPGEPCHGATWDRWSATTHVARRTSARRHGYRHADDVLGQPEMPEPVPDEWMEPAA